MKRKVMKLGPATLVVSLPSKWTREHNIKQGNEIDLEEQNNSLIIKKEHKEEIKEIKIKINATIESSIRTLITNTYRLGYGRVIVEFNNAEEFKIINNVIREQLTGFEIISKEKNICIIENVTEPEDKQVQNIFLKLLYTVNELLENIKKLMQKENVGEYIQELELRIQKYDNFCRRVASKNSTMYTALLWTFYTELVHGQREIYLLSKIVNKNHNKVSKEVLDYYNQLITMYGHLRDGYMRKDTKVLEKMHDLEKEYIYKKGYTLLSTKKGIESIITYRISSAIRNFYLASSPLIGLLCLEK